jgi:hypothetical protein
MAIGPFLSHDAGYVHLLSTDNWAVDDYYAVLATTTETPNVGTQIDYEDILAECADGDYDQVALAGKAVAEEADKVRFDCDKITFGASVSITARYLYILKGTAATPVNADEIIGHIDLDGAANVSSVNAEFSFDPATTEGLFEVSRTAAP